MLCLWYCKKKVMGVEEGKLSDVRHTLYKLGIRFLSNTCEQVLTRQQ